MTRNTIQSLRAGGMSAAKIAAELGVSTRTIYHWAAGTRRPRVANVEKLAQLVNRAWGNTTDDTDPC